MTSISLLVTEFDGIVEIQGSQRVIAVLKGNPELEYFLHRLFEILQDLPEEDIEDGEVNGGSNDSN